MQYGSVLALRNLGLGPFVLSTVAQHVGAWPFQRPVHPANAGTVLAPMTRCAIRQLATVRQSLHLPYVIVQAHYVRSPALFGTRCRWLAVIATPTD